MKRICLAVLIMCLMADVCFAPIFGIYPGFNKLIERSDAVAIVRILKQQFSPAPMAGFYEEYEIRILVESPEDRTEEAVRKVEAFLKQYPKEAGGVLGLVLQRIRERIKQLRIKYNDDPEALLTLDKEQRDIEMYIKYSKWYGSVFYVMQKR